MRALQLNQLAFVVRPRQLLVLLLAAPMAAVATAPLCDHNVHGTAGGRTLLLTAGLVPEPL